MRSSRYEQQRMQLKRERNNMEVVNWNAGSYKGRVGQRVVFYDAKRLQRALAGHVETVHNGTADKKCAACRELQQKLRKAEKQR